MTLFPEFALQETDTPAAVELEVAYVIAIIWPSVVIYVKTELKKMYSTKRWG